MKKPKLKDFHWDEEWECKLAYQPQMGDHVYIVITHPVPYEHHGIYIGDGDVVNFVGSSAQNAIVRT